MGYRIKHFSNISGLSESNLRYYEKRGLVLGSRENNGYRDYGLEDSYRINTFNYLLSQGFSITDSLKYINPVNPSEYSSALEHNNAQIKHEISKLQSKLAWNEKMIYVYSNKDKEKHTVRRLLLPEMKFLCCTENFNHEPYINSSKLSDWVENLPITKYAEITFEDKSFSLGMCISDEDACSLQLDVSDTVTIPSGTYYAMFFEDDGRKYVLDKIYESDEFRSILPERSKLFFPIVSIYTMIPTTTLGEEMHYVLARYRD